jgi:DNA helicase HerA-like ATPase
LEKRPDLGEPFLYDCIRTGRKRGARFVFLEQVIAGIPYQILGNINNRIIGRLTDGRSLAILSQITGWNEDQIDFIRNLPERHWVIQTPGIPEGAVIRIPDLR